MKALAAIVHIKPESPLFGLLHGVASAAQADSEVGRKPTIAFLLKFIVGLGLQFDERLILKTRTLRFPDEACGRVEDLGEGTFRLYFEPAALSVIGRIGVNRDLNCDEPFKLRHEIESLLDEGAASLDRIWLTGQWQNDHRLLIEVIDGDVPAASLLAPTPRTRRAA